MYKQPRYVIRKDKVRKWEMDTPSVYVDDTTKKRDNGIRRKPTKFMQYAPICERCKQIIPENHECDFCGHITANPVMIPLRTENNN